MKKETNMIIAAGDLNIILDSTLDAEKIDTVTYPNLIDDIYNLLDDCNLTDAYRLMHPEEKAFTFCPKGSNPNKIFRRLDYCFISEDLIPYLEKVTMSPCHVSDHKAVTTYLTFKERFRGRNFWRHNDTLLDIPEYVNHMRKAILEGTQKFSTECSSEQGSDPRNKWEFLKYYLSRESRAFSKKLKNDKESTKVELQTRLEKLGENPTENMTDYLEARNEWEELQREEDKKIIFQSRVTFTEHNEKPTGFFLRKIKENYIESNVIELVKDGKTLDRDKCNQEIYQFYKNLYAKKRTSKPCSKLKKVLNELPKLNAAEVSKIGRPITIPELSTTLFSRMNPGKSPGNDGLTVAFYKKFWSELKLLLFESLKASIEMGELSSSQKRSIIRLIHKRDKDPSHIKNWRPISLINCDTKILSRLITARLEQVITKLISSEQLAYIKGRTIMEGNRIIDYLIEYMSKGKDGFIVSWDMQKAFDSCDHDFIRNVLDQFGFPKEFIKLFDTLYNGAESAVMNNGLTTKYFPLERSCRHGDCLSPFLFILILEPLIRMIKQDERIKGLNPFNHNIKLSVFADDMNGFVGDEDELKAFLECIQIYGKSSGLQLNVEKTEAIHVSKKPIEKFADEQLQNINLVRFIKITGVYYGRIEDKKNVEKANFERTLNKMRSNFNSWNQRDLTILGRVMLAKCHGISLIQYLANSIEVPNWVIQNAKKLIYKFIYKGIDKITRRVASKPIECGGINLPILDDIMAAAAVQWIRKARVNKDRLWAKFIWNYLKRLGGYGSLDSLRTTKDNDKDDIYQYNIYLYKCWQHLKAEEKMNMQTFLSQSVHVWNNRRFSFREKAKFICSKESCSYGMDM
jgi:hypothetical protein